MYHIKSDKRSETSANMMYEALMACIKEKSFDEISITELVKRATVGRSTFYRNFDEITDLLYWKCNQQFYEVLHSYIALEPTGDDPLGLLQHVFNYWQDHSEILETLLNINRIDIIYDSFTNNFDIIMNYFKVQLPMSDGQYEYFIATRISVFIGVIKVWISRGKKETAKQIAAILGEQFLLITNHNILL